MLHAYIPISVTLSGFQNDDATQLNDKYPTSQFFQLSKTNTQSKHVKEGYKANLDDNTQSRFRDAFNKSIITDIINELDSMNIEWVTQCNIGWLAQHLNDVHKEAGFEVGMGKILTNVSCVKVKDKGKKRINLGLPKNVLVSTDVCIMLMGINSANHNEIYSG